MMEAEAMGWMVEAAAQMVGRTAVATMARWMGEAAMRVVRMAAVMATVGITARRAVEVARTVARTAGEAAAVASEVLEVPLRLRSPQTSVRQPCAAWRGRKTRWPASILLLRCAEKRVCPQPAKMRRRS